MIIYIVEEIETYSTNTLLSHNSFIQNPGQYIGNYSTEIRRGITELKPGEIIVLKPGERLVY